MNISSIEFSSHIIASVQPMLEMENKSQIKHFEGFNTRTETYEDLIENLDSKTKYELELKIYHIVNKEKSVLKLVEDAIHAPNLLEDPIWKNHKFPAAALWLLKEGKIDGMDFSTSQMFYNVLNHPHNKDQVKMVPLFGSDGYNPQAWNLIEKTAQPFDYQNSKKNMEVDSSEEIKPFMTSSQLQSFFDQMDKLSPLQKIFLLVPEPKLTSITDISIATVINLKPPYFNVFCRLSDKGHHLRMIPSKGMMQAYLLATGRDFTLISQFEFSSLDYLKEGILKKERPMCLNFALLPLIRKADGKSCSLEANEVEYHDFYHLDIMSLVKDADLKKFYGFLKILSKLNNNLKIEEIEESLKKERLSKQDFDFYLNLKKMQKKIIDDFYKEVVNMEVLEYRIFASYKKENQTVLENFLFWSSINFILSSIIDIYSNSGSNEIKNDLLRVYDLIASELVLNAKDYEKEFGLNVEALLNLKPLKADLKLLFAPTLFNNVALLSNAVSKEIEYRVSNLENAFKFIKDSPIFIRTHAFKCLIRKFPINSINEFLDKAKTENSIYIDALNFIADNFKLFTLKPHPELINKIRNSRFHFNNLIQTAVLNNDIQTVNLLLEPKNFRKDHINRPFNKGLTLWQIAKGHVQMQDLLVSLGAKPI